MDVNLARGADPSPRRYNQGHSDRPQPLGDEEACEKAVRLAIDLILMTRPEFLSPNSGAANFFRWHGDRDRSALLGAQNEQPKTGVTTGSPARAPWATKFMIADCPRFSPTCPREAVMPP